MNKPISSHTERVRQKVVSGELTDQVVTYVVFRQPEVAKVVQDLSEVFGKIMVTIYPVGSDKTEVIIPLVDMSALLSFMISDLSIFIQGSGDVRMMAKSFFETEVFDRDEEIDTELYSVVLDEIVRLVHYLVEQLRTTEFDHHAPHSYDLVRILHSGGLLLARASYRS